MSLVLHESFRRFFRPATLSTAQSALPKTLVSDILFFRTAYYVTMTENAQRNFAPRFLIEPSGAINAAACSCAPELKPNDLCRHVAVALHHVAADGAHMAERFINSLWHDVGQLIVERGGEVRHERRGPEIATYVGDDLALTLRFDAQSSAALLSCYPDEIRPADVLPLPKREQLLRRMATTKQEAELEKRGVVSRRQQWEATFWYGLTRGSFLYFADHDLTLRYSGAHFVLAARRGDISVELVLPPRAVARVIDRDGGDLARRSGFEVHPFEATPDVALSTTASGELRMTPMICAHIDHGLRCDDRRALEPTRCDRWFFYPESSSFLSLREMAPRFREQTSPGQQLLFASGGEGGHPRDRESVVAAKDVWKFLEKHRDEIRAMPEPLVPESIRQATPTRLADEVRFDFASVDPLVVDVSYAAGDEWISWRDIATARGRGDAVLVRGTRWIHLADPQFTWLDAFVDAARHGRPLQLTRLDYIRMRSSIRGEIVFTGDARAEQFFRSFEDHSSSGAPSLTDLGIDLYGYQQTGYQWLWFLHQNSLGGLLCDDMGLGKTHQAMALLRAITEKSSDARVLVVCPTSLIDHWRDKLSQYVPALRFESYYGGRRSISDAAQAVVTSYGTLRNDIETFESRSFDVVILDEAQVIKNRSSQTHAALSRVKRNIAIGLTGTPIENNVGELRTLIDFVVPGYLPGEAEFERSFVQPIENGNAAARERLQRMVSPFMLRRTKTQVLDQLPPKIVDLRYCELTDAQRALYREVLAGRARPLRDQLASGQTVSYLHIFAVLNHLKQICNHPATFDPLRADIESGKWNLFRELLHEALDSGLKVVVFSQYVRMLKLIERELDEQNVGWATIKGETRDRGKMLERFRVDPDCRVFTASLRAGGLGIDLTSASVVIHYDRWWNQAREDQATDRVHRLGQNRGVQVVKLITRGTLEEKIDRIISRKQQLASAMVREDDPTLVKQFTRDELEELLEDV